MCLVDDDEVRRQGNKGHRNDCMYHSNNMASAQANKESDEQDDVEGDEDYLVARAVAWEVTGDQP